MGFEAFLGNHEAVATVRAMLVAGRAMGPFLFSGPEGVGKKTLAIMLAKALDCERAKNDFCGECPRCLKAETMLGDAREDWERRRQMKDASRRVEGLIYFDLQLIEPLTRHILIEQIRRLRAVAYDRPFEMACRFFIIDQAQAIHWQAVDLLLKVLEEPPGTSAIVLVCPNPYELRATIRSRCRRIQFRPVEDALVQRLLENEKRVAKSDLNLATRLAAGSMARAKALDLEDYRRRRRPWIDFFTHLAHPAQGAPSPATWKGLFDSAKGITESREEFEDRLKIGYGLLSDLLRVLVKKSSEQLINLDVLTKLREWGLTLGMEGIVRLKDGLDHAYRAQVRNANQEIGFDALAVELLTEVRARGVGHPAKL